MCNAAWACGSAMFTIDASRMIMSWATPMTASAIQRRSWVVVIGSSPCLSSSGDVRLGPKRTAPPDQHTGGCLRFVKGDFSVRCDAPRNRERLIEVASETFASSGVDAPLEKIAKDAGVGIGTLYRHF